MHIGVQNDVNWILTCFIHERRNGPLKLIKKLVTGLMILLVALGSSPLEVFALDNKLTEWPTGGTNDVATTLPEPPAPKNIIDLKKMFNYPILDYSDLRVDRPKELDVIQSLKGYVPSDDSSVAVITRDAPWQAGVMWSKGSNKINLAEPFHMISYVYLGSRGQAEKNVDGNKRGGADGITFTIHNDNKSTSGSNHNTGVDAYGALGNGLGVYGSNFSANTKSSSNNTVYMTQGVTNGIALEFDTFYNDNTTTQHSDNDLWQFVGKEKEGSPKANLGHIGINYLNNLQYNRANEEGKRFSTDTYSDKTMIKHSDMLSVGWNGNVTRLDPDNGWQVTGATQKLADNKWHRLEVKWEPTASTTGELTYKIYRQGYNGHSRQLTSMTPTDDGNSTIDKTVDINVKTVFNVSDINNTVYWGFSGSTGYYQNNQAVQMLQLPVPYYKSGIRKVDQDGNLVKKAKFQLEVRNGETWQPVVFQKADGSGPQDFVFTGVDNGLIGVTTDLEETSPTYGKITATQLLAGSYRWVEIEAPEGYKIDSPITPQNGFELKYRLGSDNNGSSSDFNVHNTKLSQIELDKKDKDTGKPLNDVKFTISKVLNDVTSYLKAKSDNSDFEWTTTESEAKQFETGRSYFVRNGKINEETTGDGFIRIGYIESGVDLRWKEVEVPKGYDSSGRLGGSFSTPVDNKYLYQATQTNSRLYQVSLEKKASDTNAALPGAVFSLEQQVGSEWKAVGDNKTTGEDGKIIISNLSAGTYRWKEVTAPDGYQILQPYFPDQNGFMVRYESDSNLAIDPGTNNYIFNTTSVTNAPRDFELTLEKLSSTLQKPLQGVEFKLYDSAGGTDFSTLIPKATITTDADGKIVLKKEQIQAGKTYYLVESQTVDGFIQLKGYFTITTDKLKGFTVTYTKADSEADANPFVFTSTSTDTSYAGTLKIYNKQKSILPTTGGSGRTGYFIASLIFMGLVAIIGGIFYYRNRRLRHHQLLKGPNNKSHLLLLLLITSLGITFTNAPKIAADEQPITFILHKRVFKDSGDLKTIKDNGLVITPNDPNSGVIDSDKTYGLNGVTFDVYDVTNYVSNALKSTSKEALMKHVTNTDKASLLAEIKPYQPTSQEVVTVSSDGDDGVARFSVQPTSQNSAYLILEKQISDKDAGKVKMTATPMLVILPVANPIDKTSYLTTINLYPKNTAVKTPVIPPVNPVNPKPPHFPFLPDTGEVKSVMVVLGGIVVIIAVSFWYNRRKPKPS